MSPPFPNLKGIAGTGLLSVGRPRGPAAGLGGARWKEACKEEDGWGDE